MALKEIDHNALIYVALSEKGFALGTQLAQELGGEVHGLKSRMPQASASFESTIDHLGELFLAGRPIVAICASGIIIRALAPYLSDKWQDSPVVALSEDGQSIVPLIGGHHGAITIARKIADITSGHAAITTASDVGSGIALDEPPHGYQLANPEQAKNIMADIVNGAGVDISGAGELSGWLSAIKQGDDVRMTLASKQRTPQPSELVYYKQNMVIGAGCARGCTAQELSDLFHNAIQAAEIDPAMISAIGSLDLKADEPAMLSLAKQLNVPFRVFDKATLATFSDKVTDPSDIVEAEVGTPSVSEASALALAGEGAELVVTKVKSANATIAIAKMAQSQISDAGRKPGKLSLIGIGPGKSEWRTPEASRLIAEADLLVGYRLYIDLLGASAAKKPAMHFALGEEELRCRTALEEAERRAKMWLLSVRVMQAFMQWVRLYLSCLREPKMMVV